MTTAQRLALPDLNASDSLLANEGPPLTLSVNPLHQVKATLQVCVGTATLTVGELMSAKQQQVLLLDPKTEPTDTLLRYLADVGIGLALAWLLEDTAMVVASPEAADTRPNPYAQDLELKQLREQVRNLVDALPSQQRTVMRCHYVQEIPFELIATMLGLTKGRISQIHKHALTSMRQLLKERRSCDVAW